jgi:hypothetical protein
VISAHRKRSFKLEKILSLSVPCPLVASTTAIIPMSAQKLLKARLLISQAERTPTKSARKAAQEQKENRGAKRRKTGKGGKAAQAPKKKRKAATVA